MKTFTATIPIAELQRTNPEYQFHTQAEQEIVFLRLKEKYRGKGDFIDIALIDKELRLSWGLNQETAESDRLNIEALQYARRKEFSKALSLWNQAIEKNPRDPDLHYNMALILIETKEFQSGLDKCLETIKICPIYFRAYFVLGSLYSKLRQFQTAEKYLLEGLLLQNSNVMAMVNLGAVYSILKKYKEAILLFEKVIAISPKETRAYLGLGKVYMAQGDMDNASRCLKAVIKLDGDGKFAAVARKSLRTITPSQPLEMADMNPYQSDENVEQIFAEGFQAYIKGNYAEAVEAYKRYLTYRSDEADVWASLASCQLRLGQSEAAMESVRKAISHDPSKAAFYKQAGIIFDACERFQEAGQFALKAIELGKNDSVTLTIAGKSMMLSGNLQEAFRLLQEALKQNPNNLQARYVYAQVMKQMGQKEAAKENLEEILLSRLETPLKEKARREMQTLLK